MELVWKRKVKSSRNRGSEPAAYVLQTGPERPDIPFSSSFVAKNRFRSGKKRKMCSRAHRPLGRPSVTVCGGNFFMKNLDALGNKNALLRNTAIKSTTSRTRL